MIYFPDINDFDLNSIPEIDSERIKQLFEFSNELFELRKAFGVHGNQIQFNYSFGKTRFLSWLERYCSWSKKNTNMDPYESFSLQFEHKNAMHWGSGYGSHRDLVEKVFIKPFADRIHSDILDIYNGLKPIIEKKQLTKQNNKQSKKVDENSNITNITINGNNNKINQNSNDNSNITNNIDELLSLLKKEAKEQNCSIEHNEIINAIEDNIKSEKHSKPVTKALIESLPNLGSIATIGSFILSCI